jgi:para-nitrobenzyl esterase
MHSLFPRLARRHFLFAAAASASGLSFSARAMTESELFPVVETAHGKLRGLVSGGIRVFKGVRYGADTSGANRFMPPQPVAPWAGVRDATAYGNYAPQMPSDRRVGYADLIAYDLQPGGMGEDCLVLNVWTPTLDANAKRPVLVHLHGGGHYAGSGNSPQFDGEMLARFGDAVVVTLNHRIGSFGYLHLAEVGGERYAASGTVGMQDIVAALKWINTNIAAFGGDPSRVLVFGQSGGGLKTSTLMAMPSAQGLFHRAGVMSGSGIRAMAASASQQSTQQFLTLLGLKADKTALDKLHALPYQQLLAAQIAMEQADRAQGEAPRAFSPVLDGVVIPRDPFNPDAPAVSAQVPMIVGTALDERSYRMGRFDMDEAALVAYAESKAPGSGAKLAKMYRDEDPNASPMVLQARMDTDGTFRLAAQIQAERKARLAAESKSAPVWAYLWKIPSAAYGGRYGATHGVDIGPSLYDIRHGLNGPTAENLRLAKQLASAWVSFAATGNPNNPNTPRWPNYTLPERTTLVFEGDSSRTAAQADPRRAFREYWTPAWLM